jgi:hypothetical protein
MWFEAVTVITVRSTIFWDVVHVVWFKFIVCQASNQQEAGSRLRSASCYFLIGYVFGLVFYPEDQGSMFF